MLRYKNNNVIEDCIKIKGLSLKSYFSKDDINGELYESFCKNFIIGQVKKKKVNQYRQNTNTSFTFSNIVNLNRKIEYNNPNLTTLPYGYKW